LTPVSEVHRRLELPIQQSPPKNWPSKSAPSSPLKLSHTSTNTLTGCRVVARAARVWARAAPSATARCCATTSRASPSPRSAASHAAAASSASRASSTRRRAASSRCSSRCAAGVGRARRVERAPSPQPTARLTSPRPACAPLHRHLIRPRPAERHPRLGDVHRARAPQDGDGARRRVRAQAPGQDAVRLRRVSAPPPSASSLNNSTGVHQHHHPRACVAEAGQYELHTVCGAP